MARAKKDSKLKVISLGGLGEIGKNMTVLEYENDIIVVDCGLGFPDDDMLGVDLVIPDVSYLEKNIDKVRGFVLTHGHEDHIGALPYVLKTVNKPVWGTRLTVGIVANKLSEHTFKEKPVLNTVEAGDVVKLGVFSAEFIRVNHSIADACAISINTPVGTVFFSGDFKLDLTPVEGKIMDIPRIGEIGNKGVALLCCESTNVERPGYTPSEKTVGRSLDVILNQNPERRVIIATFSSNVHRVQQIINASAARGRKVAVTGRSMINIVKTAIELGYMNVPDGTLIDINEIKRYKDQQLTIVTTGSQGEPMSALYRMAFSDHDKVELGPNDLVVISAHPIPGNEKLVGKIINELFRKGVKVVYDALADVHVSGHACQEELKLMHALTRPKYFMPVHGEYRHLITHKRLAQEMGMPENHIFVSEIGKVLELDKDSCKFNGMVPSGKILVDGYGVGDVGNIVLRDRRHLAQDGLIVVVATVDIDERMIISGPDIVSRGFVYVRESEQLMDQVRQIAKDALTDCLDHNITDWTELKGRVKDDLSKFLWSKTKRKPMILPVVMNV
ncbi:MAG: ribonuclease J [Eubacteriales bacterium]|nr:ribonuclease J [Clostridiales bacterium]MDD7300748.1 ribonuclease J [Eubacteriales bacterium]MDY4435260.1 ribonuclease J [Candidatus Flemingibacterium sp.]